MITKEEVLKFQEQWGDGIISISNTFRNNQDFIKEATDFINELYAYESEVVLFKPTLASDTQFRLDKTAALSYFIGRNSSFYPYNLSWLNKHHHMKLIFLFLFLKFLS